MREEEAEAHKLVAALADRGVVGRVDGGGVHWHVDVEGADERSLEICCFWYEASISGLMLGMNPSNSRSRLRPERTAYEGPEFYVCINEGSTRIADGRTYVLEEAAQCAAAWLSGASLDELEKRSPFVNEKLRASRRLAAKLDPRLRWDIEGDPSFELWAYGGNRSCCIRNTSCSFYIGQAQVAFASGSDDIPGDIAAWIIGGVPLADLAARGAELERHAEVLELDPARWHWLHVRDRIADPDDVLASLAPLIERLAKSPVVSRFYTFSSLNRLCFSASSHYPWVGDYPVVVRSRDGAYLVDGNSYGLESALARIESSLASSPIQPFFGSTADSDLQLLTASLVSLGSALKPELVRRRQWGDVWLTTATRRCRVRATELTCLDGDRSATVACADFDDLARLAIRFLEGGAALDEIARRDPKSLG